MKLFLKNKFALIGLLTLSFSASTIAQQKRCSTMEAIQYRMQHDSAYKADYDQKLNNLAAYIAAHPSIESFAAGDTIIIPVVVHIVLPNPLIITDDNVDYFINKLNTDYAGINDDSANASNYYSVRGHSLIRFALARRDINGNATTGIERKIGAGAIASATTQPIKTIAGGGLAPWNITKYYNLWVGVGSGGLLGISPEIGPGTQTGTAIDGICCDYTVFANNPCFSDPAFNMARTSVHEVGHNMGLFHTFDQGCTGNDFQQLTSSGTSLPANLLTPSDDTPPLSVSTSGCPTQGAADGLNGCSPSIQKMFQNYMDYTNDACYSMFTNGQVARMHYVIETFRPGYLTTKGHLPPDGTFQNEVALAEIVSPEGSAMNGCNLAKYPAPVCGVGKTGVFTPRLKVTNFGIKNLNSITLNLLLNNNLISQTFTGLNVIGARSTILILANQTLINGVNTLKFYTSNPNGIKDSLNTNDTLYMSLYYYKLALAATTLPLFEGFEDNAFDPTLNSWTVVNKTPNTNTFKRSTITAKTGLGCATISLFGNTATGDYDYLKSTYLNFNNTSDSVFISFDYAYKLKGSSAANKLDTLSLEVAKDCTGAIWTSLWKNAGDALKTSTTYLSTSGFVPNAAEWTTVPVKISLQNYKNAPLYLAFKSRNGNGQNIYIDNINIYSVAPLPLKLTSFTVQQNAKNVLCKWETNQEENVNNFNIERSINGKTFESIGTTKASGKTTAAAFYQYTDENAYKLNATTLYYRLKMIDNDGKFSYSNIVYIKLGEKQSVLLYPNPAKDLINLQINNTAAATINNTIQIVDELGRVLLEKKVIVTTGTQSFELNTTFLSKGNYVIVVKGGGGVKTMKFIKD